MLWVAAAEDHSNAEDGEEVAQAGADAPKPKLTPPPDGFTVANVSAAAGDAENARAMDLVFAFMLRSNNDDLVTDYWRSFFLSVLRRIAASTSGEAVPRCKAEILCRQLSGSEGGGTPREVGEEEEVPVDSSCAPAGAAAISLDGAIIN